MEPEIKKIFLRFKLRAHDAKRGGQSVLEILIAVTLLTVSLGGVALVIFGGQSLVSDSRSESRALRLAGRALRDARATSSYNFNGIVSASGTFGEFSEQLTVWNIDANIKQLTSRISWRTDPKRVQDVELTTLVTNWPLVQKTGGDTGGGGLAGDWTHPWTLNSMDLDPGVSATDLDVVSGAIYMSGTASQRDKADFFVVDNSHGSGIIGRLDTGPGLAAIDATSRYVFAANNSSTWQLQIIDVSNGYNPALVGSFNLPGVSGSGAAGNSVFYDNQRVFVGTKNANGPEFHVIDVTNVNNPAELGSFKVGADVNAIYVSGGTAYLATSKDSAELTILDVSNPAAISQIGYFDAPGSYDALSIYAVGTRIYLGRAGGASDGLDILNAANPAAVVSVGSKDIGSDVNGIGARDNLAFLATSDTNKEFQVFDISNPASIAAVSSFNFPNVANAIDYENNIVYVAVRSNDALRVITSQ